MTSSKTADHALHKNPYIQGARGLFCLFVFFYHIHNSGLGTYPVLQTATAQFLLDTLEHGVELFFGVSGIVIIGSLRRQDSLASFAFNRANRLLPVLWATNIFVLAVAINFHIGLPPGWAIVASFFIPPPFFNVPLVNPIAWTLAFELSFYFFVALWWKFRKQRFIPPVMALIACGWLFVYPRTLMMAAGVLIALGAAAIVSGKVARFSLFWLVAYLVTLRGMVQIFGNGNVDAANPMLIEPSLILPFEVGMLLVTAIGGVALIGIIRGEGVLGRFLGSGFMTAMGNISYSFYLWHIPVMAGVKRIIIAAGLGGENYSQLLMLLISLPIAWVVAKLSYEIVEIRITNIIRGYETALFPKPAVTGS